MKISRLLCLLSTALGLCQLTQQPLSAQATSEKISISEMAHIGQFENEMFYLVRPSSDDKGTWIKLNCNVPYDKENIQLSQLTHLSMFYGTQHYTHQDILNVLNTLNLNVEVDQYVTFNELERSFHFSVANSEDGALKSLLTLIQEIAISPALTDEGIEAARQHLLQNSENSEEDSLVLKSVTAAEVRDHFAKWYQPKNMQCLIGGVTNPQATLDLLTSLFGTAQPIDFQALIPGAASEPAFTDSVDYNPLEKAYVVDGKIWMSKPDWINTSSNGQTLGICLAVAGVVAAGIGFFATPVLPILFAVGLFSGILNISAGSYFLLSSYYKDPHYVEKVRAEDLQKGCAHAYKKSRAGITLTPYERRALFIHEMVYYPQNLSKLPILLLTDLYQMSEPVLAELFTNEEFLALNDIKRDFIIQRNEYKILKANLDNELIAMMAPFALVRDSALKQVKDIYYQDYHVGLERNMKTDLTSDIQSIERDFSAGYISLDYHNDLIKEAETRYNRRISEIQDGLAAAKEQLQRNENEIEQIYSGQVEFCKQSIRYHQRMAIFEEGEYSLVQYFNDELYKMMIDFPINLSSLPDYLDLRVKS